MNIKSTSDMAAKAHPKVYSYTRFSSPEQALGDSERRQIEAAHRFAQEHKLTLDDELKPDRGLSGFHGTHRKRGNFGEFLKRVEAGEVPRGSILLVENTDRLSREPVLTVLTDVVGKLLNHGITIQTLMPPDTFTTESVNTGGIWRLVAYITMANAESGKKSERSKANWQQKRKLATEKILTGRGPAWLKAVNGQWEVIPEAAETVRLIYQLKLDGFGKATIERKLNESAPWTPPKNRKKKSEGWRMSYVEKILRSRAVIGEFQPMRLLSEQEKKDKGIEARRVPDGEPIPNYYPAIVEPKVFHAVQAAMRAKSAVDGNGGGRTGKALNLFPYVERCGYCGGAMVFVNKGPTVKGGKYLICDNGRRGVKGENGKPVCKAHSVNYDEFEETLLDNLSKLRADMVLPQPDEQAKQAKQLRVALDGIVGQVADTEQRMSHLFDQIEAGGSESFRASCRQRYEKLEAKKRQLQTERVRLETALRELERGAVDFDRWQKSLAGLKKAISEDVDTRIRLRAHLREFINRVEIFAKGHEDSVDEALDMAGEAAPEIEGSKFYGAFVRYLRRRLVSPEGRFYRLFLKSERPVKGARPGFQVAPADSLARRIEIRGKQCALKGPEVGQLCRDFFDGRKPGFVPKTSFSGN